MTQFTITLGRLEAVLKGREVPPIAWAYEQRFRHIRDIYFGVHNSPDRFRMTVNGSRVALYKEKRELQWVSTWEKC